MSSDGASTLNKKTRDLKLARNTRGSLSATRQTVFQIDSDMDDSEINMTDYNNSRSSDDDLMSFN